MANVGSAAAGKTLIGAGVGASPTYASIGTNSGLTTHGVVIAEGNGGFSATTAGNTGQVLTSNGSGADPSFQPSSSSGSVTTITGNTGGAESPSAGNFNILGTGSITIAGSANTETVQLTGLTNHAIQIGAGSATLTQLGAGTTGQVLQTNTTADPTWSTATYPSTTTINQILYSSSANTVGGLATANSAILNTNSSGIPSLATSPSCSGTLTAGTGLVVTNGNLNLPTTSSTAGILQINSAAFLHAYGSQNAFLGIFSGNFSLTGTYDTGLGYGTLNALTSGGRNTAVGGNSGNSINSGADNTCMGYISGSTIAGGGQNTCIGSTAGNSISSGSTNTCIGYNAGATVGSANDNTFVGNYAGQQATGADNVAVGSQAMNGYQAAAGAAAKNTVIGFAGGYRISTGTDNTIMGYNVAPFITTGTYNTAIGDSALSSLSTGSYNTCLGYNSGNGYATGTEASNICIGAAGTSGESHVLRIGTAGSGNGQVSTCYIAGISGVTVTGTAVLCSSSGQLGTIASSIRYKENINPIKDEISVINLSVKSFNYKDDPSKSTHYGLIAEEVDADFPYLCFYDDQGRPESVKYHELCVFLLAEVQRLNKRIQVLEIKV